MIKTTLKLILGLLFFVGSFSASAQCDVYIEPGSVQVIDNGGGVQFQFEVTNNSDSDWYGGVLKMYWSLNSVAPIWEIDYTDHTNQPPIAPGETRSIKTPWFDIPNLPSWFPEEEPSNDNPWVESMEWPFYTLSFPFNGSWSPMNLRLGSCGLADGAWVYDEAGELYYGPTNTDCPNVNGDQFCDCEISFLDFNHATYDATLQINGWQNCANPLNNGSIGNVNSINNLVFAIHVPGWDYGWGCTNNTDPHEGWTFIISTMSAINNINSEQTITVNLLDDFTGATECFQEILEDPTLPCREIVIWQINFSQTATVFDFENGWAVDESSGNSTAMYPDIYIEDNRINYCNTPNAFPTATNIDVICVDNEPTNVYHIRANNNGLDTLFYYCVEIPEIGYNECFDGYESGQLWIEPNGGQLLATVNIDQDISQFTVIVYNAEDELDEFYYDNSVEVNLIISDEDPCNIVTDVEGCMDPIAENYNPDATIDDGSCDYFVDLAIDTLLYTLGGCDTSSIWWQPEILIDNLGDVEVTEFCVKLQILGQTDDTLCFNNLSIQPGESTSIIFPPSFAEGVVSIHLLDVNGESPNSWNDFGQDNDIENNMAVYIFNMTCSDCMDQDAYNYNEWADQEQVPSNCVYGGCIDADAINFDPDADVDDGTCIYEGCTDPDAVNFNPLATIEDGSCEYEGCTDPDAVNFDPIAIYDDGSCMYSGCTDPVAANYDSNADIDDGSCIYMGCTDPSAYNYDNTANVDDGSCLYSGCTDTQAFNFDPTASIDDGSCEYIGCTDPSAQNYNPGATIDDGSCYYMNITDCSDPLIFIPNAFTPNNDGVNDAWHAVTDAECWRDWHIAIFNRWGEKIWESRNPDDVWIGNVKGGGYYAADGTYVYTIVAHYRNSTDVYKNSGTITLLR